MRRYQIAFFIAVAAAVLLGGAAAWVWFHPQVTREKTGNTAQMNAADASSQAPEAQPKLLPVQLTPQRAQSIGVKTGVVEDKLLSTPIRTVGNVEVDET